MSDDRAAFEAWAAEHWGNQAWRHTSTTCGEWAAWQAARATLDAAVAAERERCAAIAAKTVCDTHLPTGIRIYGTAAAKAIRGIGGAAGLVPGHSE